MPVVDASVVVDWVAPDVAPGGSAGQLLSRLVDAGDAVLAPRLVLEEVSHALLTGCRRRRWDGLEADQAFQLLLDLPLSLVDEPADLARAYALSRRYDEHPVYGMIYVAVAERLGQVLYTADLRLQRTLEGLDFVRLP